jgi:circadian clock protein KaiC
MINRIGSGQPQLDTLLGGGLPMYAISLIAGAPGTGKTMLAQQYLFENATTERSGLYLTTTSEPLDKVVRFGQELSYFDSSKVGSAVLYESLAQPLAEGGLDGVTERIFELIRDARPGVLVIDSFKAFAPYARDPLAYREFVAELAGRISPLPITAFWIGEYAETELMELPEAAVADAIVLLKTSADGLRTARSLQVLKLRGGDFLSGQHAYRLSQDGLHAFPRLADPVDVHPAIGGVERLSIGVPGLDEMLGGGVFRGSTTLLVGPTGAGKTMVALRFLTDGAARGEAGVFATLQENPSQLARIVRADDKVDGRLVMHRRSPVDIYIDEWVYELLEHAHSADARLLVIDSLSDLRVAAPDAKRFEEYTYSLVQRLATLGITTVMTLESPPSLGFADLPSSTISHLADNIVLLGYQVDGSTVRRGVHVMKSRASGHDDSVREFRISRESIDVLDPLRVPAGTAPGSAPPSGR